MRCGSAGIAAAVVELLPGGTAIAVAFGLIRETLGTVERAVLSVDTVAGSHIGSDAPIRQPLQELPVPVGRVGRHRFWLSSLPLRETGEHVLRGHRFLTHPRRRRLHSHDHATVDCPPDSCRSTPAGPEFHPWWRRSNRDRWSTPDLAHAPALRPGSAAPVPPDTGARFGSPAPLPLTARAECGSPSPHWPPRNCHPPTGACPAPIPLPHTAARSAQTTPRTASTPETVRAGSSRTWSDAGSPDRSPDR